MPHELRTFGGLDLRDAGGEPTEALLVHSKGMALLVYLAVEAPEEGIDRGRVTALLWPDREEARARNALSITLTRIRQATDPPLIEGKGESRLRPARERIEADIWTFREALNRGDVERALSLYRGDFLAGFQVADASPFERWTDQQRERFRDRAHDAALTAGRAARGTGNPERATTAFERALELRPFRQEAAVEFVRTLAEQGRTAEALQRYEAFRKRREAELDLPPSEDFEGLVERIRAGEFERRVSEAEEPAKQSAPSPLEGAGTRGREDKMEEPPEASEPEEAIAGVRFWQRPAGGAVGLLALAAVSLGLWQVFGANQRTSSSTGDRSVAVLPFEAVGTESPGPIAEGLHNDLLTRLSHVSGLEVVSATSVERYRHTELELPAIADSLGVRWVVEGDVQRAGDAIQVNAQLVDPGTDTHAWADTYRRELTTENLFAVQSELTKKIVRSLEGELSAGEAKRIAARPTDDLDAYRFYVQGRQRLAQRKVRGDPHVQAAVEYFRRAIERDSSFALAWTGLADAAAYDPPNAADSITPPRVDQRSAARRAVELDPDLAEAHASMGFVHLEDQKGPAALRALERALELKPSYAEAHAWLGELYLKIGRLQKALDHLTVAVELNPRHAWARHYLYDAYLAAGQPEKSLAAARRQQRLGLEREGAVAGEVRALYNLGRLQEALDLTRDQMARLEETASWKEEGTVGWKQSFRCYLGILWAAQGDTARAHEHVKQLVAEDAHPILVGSAYAGLGQPDRSLQAFRRLEHDDWGHIGVVATLRYGPLADSRLLAPLQNDPRYRELLREGNRAWGLNPDGSLPDRISETSE